MPRITVLIFCLVFSMLLVSCNQSTDTTSSFLLNESVIYPSDEPPSIQISTVNDLPSLPKISLDKTKLSYIAPFDFETFGENQSVKQVHWLDNSHLLILTGNRYGTISSNSVLYVLNISSKKAKSVLQVGEYQNIRDLVVYDSEIAINIANYNEDFTEESLETKTFKISELTGNKDSDERFSYLKQLSLEKQEAFIRFTSERNLQELYNFTPEEMVLAYLYCISIGDPDLIYEITFNGGNLPNKDEFRKDYFEYAMTYDSETAVHYRYYDSVKVDESTAEDNKVTVLITVGVGTMTHTLALGLQKENQVWKLDIYHSIKDYKNKESNGVLD